MPFIQRCRVVGVAFVRSATGQSIEQKPDPMEFSSSSLLMDLQRKDEGIYTSEISTRGRPVRSTQVPKAGRQNSPGSSQRSAFLVIDCKHRKVEVCECFIFFGRHLCTISGLVFQRLVLSSFGFLSAPFSQFTILGMYRRFDHQHSDPDLTNLEVHLHDPGLLLVIIRRTHCGIEQKCLLALRERI
jgi:hypothetical protein